MKRAAKCPPIFYNYRMSLKKSLLSVEEYLELEAELTEKHEYAAGELFATAGGTERHSQPTLNLVVKLWAKARAKGCRVFASDMKVRVPNNVFSYPDVMVVCEDGDDEPLYKTQPCLITEVLSPNTEVIDRREKLQAYQQVPSLQAYLLVSTETPRVEGYYRREAGWVYEASEGMETTNEVSFPCPGLTLSLEAIFEGLTF